eukprot:6809223-Prymnesium_polylepis.2
MVALRERLIQLGVTCKSTLLSSTCSSTLLSSAVAASPSGVSLSLHASPQRTHRNATELARTAVASGAIHSQLRARAAPVRRRGAP